jgi:hypothetical protein
MNNNIVNKVLYGKEFRQFKSNNDITKLNKKFNFLNSNQSIIL